MESKKLDADYLHSFFCEKMDCEKWSSDDLKIISMDELDYLDKLKEEDIDSENNVSSIYKQFRDGHYELYVNEDELKENPFLSIEILFSQLLNFYAPIIPYYTNAKNLITKLSWIRSIEEGYNIWLDFSSICISSRLCSLLFRNAELDFVNPYSDDNYKDNIITILKLLPSSDDSKENKFSVLLYSFGKLANIENDLSHDIKNFRQLNSIKLMNMSEIIDAEWKNFANSLYSSLAKSTISAPNISLFIKLYRLKTKIMTQL